MFSGIVHCKTRLLERVDSENLVRIWVERPASLEDVQVGDSVALDGVCLTVEQFDQQRLLFAIAPETLKVIEFYQRDWKDYQFNLEPSLRFGDRVHGHMVTGHVDGLGQVVSRQPIGESLELGIEVPSDLRSFLWKKGSVGLNGVSLTINEFDNGIVKVCLIPETLARTNLGALPEKSLIHVEVDSLARAMVHVLNERVDNARV